MNLKPGDIIFVDSGTFFGNLVKWGTGFKYGHVAIAVDDQYVIDIRALKDSSIEHIDDLKRKTYEIKRCKETFDPIMLKSIIVNSQGIPYDYAAVFKLFFQIRLGIKAKNNSYDIKSTYCSEFIEYVYSLLNIDLVEGKGSLISIEDIYNSDKLEVVEHG